MKGGTTTWSEMPVSQRTALENLASMAGVPSGLLSASVDAMANTTKYERESAGNDYQFIGGTENQPAGVFDKLTGTFTPTGASATGVVKSGAGNYYDIASYATDPNHESSVQSILNRIGQFKTTEDIDNYINSVAPSSPITGQMVANASNKYGVDWETITAIMQQDSSLGTAGAGARSFNPGNVGNTETATSTGKLVNFGSWQAGVDAVAKNLAWRKTTAPVSAGASTTEAYAKDILAGKMKIENVPEKIRGDVMAAKAELEKTQKPLADQLMAESLDKKILDLKYLEDSVSSDGKGVVGPSAIARMGLLSFTRLSGRAQNFIAGVEQMISQETIDKLVQSKAAGATYGALSDGERLMLASAASKIGTWRKLDSKGNIKGYNISEAALKKELSTIRELSQKARDRIMGDSVIQSNGLSEEDAYQEYLNIKNK